MKIGKIVGKAKKRRKLYKIKINVIFIPTCILYIFSTLLIHVCDTSFFAQISYAIYIDILTIFLLLLLHNKNLLQSTSLIFQNQKNENSCFLAHCSLAINRSSPIKDQNCIKKKIINSFEEEKKLSTENTRRLNFCME